MANILLGAFLHCFIIPEQRTEFLAFTEEFSKPPFVQLLLHLPGEVEQASRGRLLLVQSPWWLWFSYRSFAE